MRTKIALTALIAMLAVAGYLGYVHFFKTWSYSISDGFARAYSISLSSETTLDAGVLSADDKKSAADTLSGKFIAIKTSTDAELQLKFYRDSEKGWNIAGKFSKLKISINSKSPGWVWAAGYPFSFSMNKQGYIDNFKFTPGLPDEAVSFITGLIYELQAALPEKKASSWKAKENCANGRALMSYKELAFDKKADVFDIEKKKLSLLEFGAKTAQLPFLSNPSMNIVKSDSRIKLNLPEWISEITGSEVTAYLADGHQWSRSESSFSLMSIEAAKDVFPAGFAEFNAQILSEKLVGKILARTDPTLDAEGADLDMNGALSKYLEMMKTDKKGAEKFFVNYLKQKPAMIAELLGMLDADIDMKRFDKKTQLVLWRLIVESGTPEAQKAVMDAALNPSYGRTTHIRALVNCIDFTNPQGFMVDDLLKLHRNPALNGEAESGAIYANMSLLAVGSLGYRDKLNNETIEKVAGELTDNLKNAEKNISETALTLSAIGNTGNNNLIPVVKPYLDDNDEMVRKAAAESLRRMDDPEAQKLLISRYEKDASQKVREEALKSLNETPLTKESDAWARESVLNAQTPNETVLIIEILGKTLKTYPQNDAALRKLLDKNPPIPVKQTIFKFIAPKR